MCGMEEEIFPSSMAMFSNDPTDIEEERRLCYVGITRAIKKLTLSGAVCRMHNGNVMFHSPSRFIREIPRYLMKQTAGGDIPHHTPAKNTKPASSYSPKKASIYSADRKNPFKDNPYIQKGLSTAAPDYRKGDTVSHVKFGNGTVFSIEELDGDYEVIVEFDGFGKRKLRASFAKLKKV
jgi:DNA helicase-2/ATP-dependent DNA helicase PcrA